MHDYIDIIVRTILSYVILLVVFRLMGKREVGELSIVDMAIFILMAEVAAFALDGTESSFIKAVFPIVILFCIQYLNSWLILKNKKLRDFIEGDPTIIIRDGWLQEQEMKKQRYNLDDLMQQLREQGVGSIQEIAYAFLEQSGRLSVYKKGDPPFLFPLIVDGYVDERHLMLINKDRKWLEQELLVRGYPDLNEIFFCSYEQGKWFVQLRARKD